MPYSLSELSKIIHAQLKGDSNKKVDHHVFDSRNILQSENTAFWAFSGNRNGHDFIEDAYQKGIRIFISNTEISLPNDASLLRVDNTLQSLQKLAKYHLHQNTLTTIGITGSNGKTIVKEWLYQCLIGDQEIVRSPKSYNSQIGLPLSLLQINPTHTLGIFEVGISQINEMNALQKIFQPQIGVITNIRESHLENFESHSQLVQEKLSLFSDTPNLIYNVEIQNYINQGDYHKSISFGSMEADVYAESTHTSKNEIRKVSLKLGENHHTLELAFSDKASLENISCVAATLQMLGYSDSVIIGKLQHLHPVEMRLELKNANENSLLIKDEYSLDYPSLEAALNVLNQQVKKQKVVVLSDFDSDSTNLQTQEKRVIELLNNISLDAIYFIGNRFQAYAHEFTSPVYFYENTQKFIDKLSELDFTDKAILIKGARKYGLENISEQLVEKTHETILEVSLHNIMQNYSYFKSLIQPTTKTMIMVKANAYGLGMVEVAKTFQHYGANYLGVAYADEGEILRQKGIQTPIMVMNPDEAGFSKMIKYSLEPEIYGFHILQQFTEILKSKSLAKPYPIHIKIDTGMHRLGFLPHEMRQLALWLQDNPYVEVVSIFSHLSSANNSKDKAFTLQQIETFNQCYKELTKALKTRPIKHILNTSGVLKYTDYQYDMIRLGIGLYDNSENEKLTQVVQLKTHISQIKNLPKGESIGYNREYTTSQPMKIAILPIGYADGVSRKVFHNGYKVLIHNVLCEIIGVVCMDMIMVNISHIECKEGDEVVVFGAKPSLKEYAKASETITYECLTSISSRIKRVYYKE